MAEEEVNYASVVFKIKSKQQPQAEQEEETVYSNVKVQNNTSKQSTKTKAEEEDPGFSKVKEPSQTSEPSANTNASLTTDKNEKSRRPSCLLVASFLAIVCVILIAAIIVVCISFFPLNHNGELEHLKENQTLLLEEKRNLTDDNNRLNSENQNLAQNLDNLTIRFENLTEAYDVSELRVTKLTEENHQLTTENHQLTTENQGLKTENKELKTQSNNLAQQIQDKETEWIQSNVSRAQWSINAYCRIDNIRQCRPCQKGWRHKESSCYAFNDAKPPGQKTWTEAQEVCRGKGSHLVIIADKAEKKNVNEASLGSSGFWIGLRVEDGKWKWVDGSDLNKDLWTQPAVEGRCALLFKKHGWRSVNCSRRNQWVCEQAALSV